MCVVFFFFFFFFQEGSGACQHPDVYVCVSIGQQRFVSILTSIGAGKKSQERAQSQIFKRP